MQPEFVGRLPQIEAALECLRRAGVLRVVCVLGVAGIGKSRFASELVERAEALGLKYAWGGCWEQPGAGWLWPFRQLGRRLEAQTGSGVLARIGAASGLMPDSSEARAEWLLSIADALAALGREQELCLVLDDLQWADLGTLTLIELLVQQRAPLGLVLTWREQDAASNLSVAQPLDRVRRAGFTVALEGLELQEVADFFETLGQTLSVDVAHAVRDKTGGNPFFLSEVGRSWRSASPHSQLTEGVRTHVQRRMQLLPPECRSLIEVASVVGREFDTPALIACTQGEPGEIAAALSEGLRHGFLTTPPRGAGESKETALAAVRGGAVTSDYRFLHDLTRESVYEGLSKERRTALHRAWAESWIRTGDVDRHAGRIFEHLMLAGAEAGLLGRWARLAAEAHLSHQDYEAAISVVERSLPVLDSASGHHASGHHASGHSPELARLLVLRAKATLLSGDPERGIQLCKQAAALARSECCAVALGEAALAWGLETRFSQIDAEHVALLEEALASVEAGETELRIRLTARLAAALQPGREPSRAIELAKGALASAREHGDPITIAWVLFHARGAFRPLDSLEERQAWDREALVSAEALVDPLFELRALERLALDELELGDRCAAELLWKQYGELAQRLGRTRCLCTADQHRALLCTWRGAIEPAREALEQARARRGALAASLFDPVAAQHLMLARWWGRRSWLEEGFERLVLAPGTEVLRGAYHQWLGEDGMAAEFYGRIAHRSYPGHYFDLALRPELCVACGTLEEAHRLYQALLGFKRRHVVYWAAAAASDGSIERLLGCLASRSGDIATARSHFERALADNERLGAPQLLARTREDYAAALSTSHHEADATHAKELFSSARELYQTLEMTLDLARLRARESASSGAVKGTGGHRQPTATSANAVTVLTQVPDFANSGEYWTLSFEGASLCLKDGDGLHYLAWLIARPGQSIHVLELMAARRGAERPLGGGESALPSLDGRAVKAQLRHPKQRRREPGSICRLCSAGGGHQEQGDTGLLHREKVLVSRQQPRRVGQRIGRDQKVEGLRCHPSTAQTESQFASIRPQV